MRRSALLLLALGSVSLAPSSAAAQALRFTKTTPGGIVATGNTLGLSKQFNANGPGTSDSIGTFLSLDATSVDDDPANPANPWPMGTTNDWTKNGSTAVLPLPVETEVLYAELLWGGSTNYGENVTGDLGTPVTLTAGAATIQVTPSAATALTIATTSAQGFAANYYMRSADVTAFVKAARAGMYSVAGVPATQTTTINSLNAAGWSLVVAYRQEGAPIRNLSVFVGGSFVDENSQQDYQVSGFCAPPAGVVEGTAVVSAIEGDANLTGDQLLIGSTPVASFTNLSGPNNPANNFFCSQMNDAEGKLDTKGSFGMMNQNATAGTNVSGGRQGWDVTTVPLSSADGHLQNGQTSATLRTITTGDSYVPILAAFAIDVNSPDFSATGAQITVTPDQVELGDTFTATAMLENKGDVTAQNLTLTIPLETGLAIKAFTLDGSPGDANGAPVDAAALAAGIDAGALPAGQTRQFSLELEVKGPPQFSSFGIAAKWAYEFQVCANGESLEESHSQFALVKFDEPVASTSASTGASSGSGTTSAGSGSGGQGGDGGSGGASYDDSAIMAEGCGCAVPGEAKGSLAPSLAALALAALWRRRRGARG